MKYLVIDKNAIRKNIRTVKEQAAGRAIYADLSADACGMGLMETAKLLRDEGIRYFAVSDPNDAKALRDNGFIEETIMMLRSTADASELSKLIDLGVICTVGSYDAAVAINGLAEARKTVCEVQIKVDTGLGRYGFMETETDKIASVYKYMPNLAVVGIFTTLAETWKKSSHGVENQLVSFKDVLSKLNEMGFETGVTHAIDSAALFMPELDKFDAVRVDSALSGRIPGKSIPALAKVGFIEACIEEVGWFPKGHKITGGRRLRKAARLAVLSVGYYNGFGDAGIEGRESFFRRLFPKHSKYIKIGSKKAKVMGKIGMMHTIIDVTSINCSVGDMAVMDVDPINVKGLATVYRPTQE